ncbi:heptaprenylglyceryl phosphate synthase [Kurthia zopfii]|uniref:Heptaprenylglyceryl phosphate synthase n=1 Tax=Kurthia zopfii TaxID=1650 RepID=A0A2U3AAU3_9BACL|nr:heptaprenylglyceryl phosphate synthase [Kurthia zopfii]PWI21658.1 heptaprenylglyceryl phosphate synthase [Kurthia zopfii]TDR35332.1 putative glycerol-1-phosphate prenyltransferase [Kurthia zopfii]STX10770.1 Heptaprenylglyceryl phosphate synthase [Kurthia zopfii]VEI05845.1 Heptaprenylglyceryl phosphate synthase [Kurthia zopfii]GEK31379.1 heptaprenylglyceryl phosphate synthase [Kurthia zopfii]
MEFENWQHMFKLDPAKLISEEHLEMICESGTDGILVGGSDDVTSDGVLDLLARVRRYSVPVILEVSTIESVTPGFDYFFIPTVLNSTDTRWVKDLHHEAITAYGDFMHWDELVAEGYIILNPDCKAAKLTAAQADLTHEEVIAYARMVEHYFKLPILYVEYSGMYGSPELVKDIAQELNHTQLFYGGGITTLEQAEEMAQYADTIVVGNIIYDDLKNALKTVKAVKVTI